MTNFIPTPEQNKWMERNKSYKIMDGVLFDKTRHKVCEHGRRKEVCVPCKGQHICEHGRYRYTCIPCKGQQICEHGRRKTWCRVCDPQGAAKELIRSRIAAAKAKKLDASGLMKHKDDLVKIIVGGKSVLSGIPFNQCSDGAWNSASIDQEKAGAGYTWDNIRVVLDAENKGMNNWGKEITLYVWLSVALREAEKRGDHDFVIGVLQYLTNFYEKQAGVGTCQSSSTSAQAVPAERSNKSMNVSAIHQTKRSTVTSATRRSKNSSGARRQNAAQASPAKETEA